MENVRNMLLTLLCWSGVVMGGALLVGTFAGASWWIMGQFAALGLGYLACIVGVYMAVVLIEHGLDNLMERWMDGDAPWNLRYEGYWEDHRDGVDQRIQWHAQRPTLLTDLQFVQYLVTRWLFRTRYDLMGTVCSWWARKTHEGVYAALTSHQH